MWYYLETVKDYTGYLLAVVQEFFSREAGA